MASGSQKMAVLLCKFKDTEQIEPQPRTYFEDLFTGRGTGGLNDYWLAATHGNVNLDGTEIHGWTTLDQNRADFIATHVSRWDKIQGAIDAFPNIDFSQYPGIVAIYNSSVGDGGRSGKGILVQSEDYSSSFIAHEQGHVFNLAHSFDESNRKLISWSAPGEYYDKYDIMSAMNVHNHTHPRFGLSGPIVCAPNMDRMDWLDPTRIWTLPHSGSGNYTFDLVSLAHPEIPGYLAAKAGDSLYIEFRTKDGWDKGIPGDTVLIHHLVEPNAVLVTQRGFESGSYGSTWDHEWLPGEVYDSSSPVEREINGGTQIVVESFDLPAKKARIRVRRQAPRPTIAGHILGGVAHDGGGYIILPSGRIVKVPPRSPILTALLSVLSVAVEIRERFSVRRQFR